MKLVPISKISISTDLAKRGWSEFGVIESNRKLSLTLLKNLLYKSVFQGIKVFEFFLLDQQIHSKWRILSEKEKFSFVALLSLCCERRRPSLQWESNIRRTLSKVRNYLRVDQFGNEENFLDFLLKNNLIVKDVSIVLKFSKLFLPHSKPLPIASMGVGYKDKGSSSISRGFDPSADTRLLLQSTSFSPDPGPFYDENLSPSVVLQRWPDLLGLNLVDDRESLNSPDDDH